MQVEIEMFKPEDNQQARFIVRGVDDVLWTDSPKEATDYLRQELERYLDGDFD